MNTNYQKLIKMAAFLALLCVVIGMLSRVLRMSSESLNDYADANPELAYSVSGSDSSARNSENTQNSQNKIDLRSNLASALLNAAQPVENYTLYSEGFYYAPLSDTLKKNITGKSYPKEETADSSITIASLEDLYFLHIWYFNFENEPVEGGVICNKTIVNDLAAIFCELYRNKYCLDSVLPIDEFHGSCKDSIENNNCFCFGYFDSDVSSSSLHELGLAVSVNPLYNPSVTYDEDGNAVIFPDSAAGYENRSRDFDYKIDTDDLCYRLFTEHGFVWGGNRNSGKNYSLFEFRR